MAGLLDTGDPEKDAALYRGLLTAGLQLMQSRGRFLPALSQGGMAGLGGYEQEINRQLTRKRIGLQDEILKNQADEQKRQAALQQIAGQYIKPDQQGNNPSAFVPGSMDLPGLAKAYMAAPGGLQTGLALQGALQKQEPKLETIAPGGLGGYFKDGKFVEVARNPKEDAADKESPIAKLIAERDKFPPGDPTRRIYDAAILKASTHQEPASINNYAGVQPIDLGGGKTGYIQPASRPGGPSQIVRNPETGQPAIQPPSPTAGKLGEAQKKQVTGIDALGGAVDEYVKELSTFPLTGVINPADRARIGTKYNNMMLQAKEAYNLGVLNGPDYQILQSVVTDPVSLRGLATSNRSLATQATELKRMMEQVKATITKTTDSGIPNQADIEAEMKRRGLK